MFSEDGQGLCCPSCRWMLVPPLDCQDREWEGQETRGDRMEYTGWGVGFEQSLWAGWGSSSCCSVGKYHGHLRKACSCMGGRQIAVFMLHTVNYRTAERSPHSIMRKDILHYFSLEGYSHAWLNPRYMYFSHRGLFYIIGGGWQLLKAMHPHAII